MRPDDDTIFPGAALSAFFDGHPVATFAIDTEHVVTHWNSACEQLLGYPAAAMVGTREHWRAFYRKPRACLADLLVADDIALGEHGLYQGKLKPSPVIPGAYEAEDFFPAFGEAVYAAKRRGKNCVVEV